MTEHEEIAQIVNGVNRLERFPTGVPGLDEVFGGGLMRRDIYLLAGRSGTGNTTLGNQVAHHHTASGGSRSS